jgi:hypothetical protein
VQHGELPKNLWAIGHVLSNYTSIAL